MRASFRNRAFYRAFPESGPTQPPGRRRGVATRPPERELPLRVAPTEPELDRMRAIMATAMRQGAMGMTTALIYPPSSFATTDELVEVGHAAAEHGGIYASHIRDEGAGLVGAVREAIEIGERTGMPVEIFHYKGAYEPGWGTLIKEAPEEIEDARARGVDLAADMYPYTAGGTGLTACFPPWASADGMLFDNLADPDMRDRIRAEILEQTSDWENLCSLATPDGTLILGLNRHRAHARG